MKYLRIAVLLAGLIMLGGGGYTFARNYIRTAEVRNWPRTQAQVTDSRVDILHRQEVGNEGDFMPHVRYDYAVGGRTYHGDTMWLDERRSFGSANVAARELAFLETGTATEVIYNPQAPREAALMIDKPTWRYLFLALLGLLFIRLAWRLKLPPRPQPMPQPMPGQPMPGQPPQPVPQSRPQLQAQPQLQAPPEAPIPAQVQVQLQEGAVPDGRIVSRLTGTGGTGTGTAPA